VYYICYTLIILSFFFVRLWNWLLVVSLCTYYYLERLLHMLLVFYRVLRPFFLDLKCCIHSYNTLGLHDVYYLISFFLCDSAHRVWVFSIVSIISLTWVFVSLLDCFIWNFCLLFPVIFIPQELLFFYYFFVPPLTRAPGYQACRLQLPAPEAFRRQAPYCEG